MIRVINGPYGPNFLEKFLRHPVGSLVSCVKSTAAAPHIYALHASNHTLLFFLCYHETISNFLDNVCVWQSLI